ncbi:MAG TPA: SDR family oxidoreductase [Bryobacteraceae bacterium]|nr:SDR family oxidoreductase [Bryobacteraceae bacterium]
MGDTNSILVIGGAGYLGCVLVEELLDRGYAVTVFDRLFFGDFGMRKFRDRIRLLTGDMRTIAPSALENVSALVNLGGLSNDPTAEYNPEANHQMNTMAARSLAEIARRQGVKRYIFASSCSIYDVGVVDEEHDVLFTEDAAVQPRAAYAVSKLAAEQELFALRDEKFSPVALRMGTVFGFSPRMRYDLVVNTFVKDAFSRGTLTLHYGGQMWRPLVDVRDAARAYIVALEAPDHLVAGQIFNVVSENHRISELALRVREGLRRREIDPGIQSTFEYAGIRNYRVSGKKIFHQLNYKPVVSVEESVAHMVDKIREYGYTDFDNDRYYNIRWMKLLEQVKEIIDITGTIFDVPSPAPVREFPHRRLQA